MASDLHIHLHREIEIGVALPRTEGLLMDSYVKKDNPTAPENEVISSYKTDGITSTSLFIFIFAFLYVGK